MRPSYRVSPAFNAYVILTALTLCFLSMSLIAGCASTPKSESTGQYVDDSAITAKIKTDILKDPALKVTQINVETYKGVVQLSGFVDSQESIKRATDVAASVPGVVSVRNNLVIK